MSTIYKKDGIYKQQDMWCFKPILYFLTVKL